jgi:replicative DNA helicase
MDRNGLARRIFRSLCANSPEEEASVLENFRNTRLDHLSFTGIEEVLLKRIHRYFHYFGGPPSTDTLKEEAERELDTTLKIYIGEVAAESFQWGANYATLLETYAEVRTNEKLTSALIEISQIQKEGKIIDPRSRKSLKGTKEAIDFAITSLTKLRRESDPYQKPLTKAEALHHLREQYAERMANPILSYGLGTGLSPIDEATKGAQNKELWMIAGFAGHGKTTWMLNWTRYLAYEGGFNILYFSLEMDRHQVWRILATGHCAHPKFNRPLEYEKIKSGTLEPDDADFFLNEVIPDLENCEGHIEVLNPIGTTTMDDIQAQAEVINKEHPLDLLAIDYLGIVSPGEAQKRMGKGERINDNIMQAKRLTTEFNHGDGITIVSAHQINREGLRRAKDNSGVYEMSAIADANECERCVWVQDILPTNKGYQKVADLKKPGLSVGYTFGQREIKSWYDSGLQKMLEIRNDRGRSFKVSVNTRVRVWDGQKQDWKTASNLMKGDTLISAQGYNLFGDGAVFLQKSFNDEISTGVELPYKMTISLSWLLGLYQGKSVKNPLDKTASNLSIPYAKSEALARLSDIVLHHFNNDLALLKEWLIANDANLYLESKQIPQYLWNASKKQAMAWVDGVWVSLGEITPEGIIFRDLSLGLAAALQEILLNLGVDSCIEHESDKILNLSIKGKESLAKILGLKLCSTSVEDVNLLKKAISNAQPTYYNNTEVYLRELTKADNKHQVKKEPLPLMTSEIAKSLMSTQKDSIREGLRPFAERRWQFSTIVGIEDAGVLPCADITVGGDFEYQFQGVLLHNSADALFCIFQDPPLRQRKEAVITNLKNRDGRIVDPFSIYLPAEYRLVAELAAIDEEQLSKLLIA